MDLQLRAGQLKVRAGVFIAEGADKTEATCGTKCGGRGQCAYKLTLYHICPEVHSVRLT